MIALNRPKIRLHLGHQLRLVAVVRRSFALRDICYICAVLKGKRETQVADEETMETP